VEVVEASIALVQALRLHQITGGAAHTDQGLVHRIGDEKVMALLPHLQDALERDEKVVVCGRFKADLNAIAGVCEDLGLKHWELRGGIKREDTDRNIRHFREWDEAGVFIMQPAAGSLGIDLRTAHKMVWYSHTNSYVDFSQSCDRIALSNRSTTFVHLLAKGTVDEILYQTLQNDDDVAKLIITNPDMLRRH
jgi:hypothetical protein